ncbi:Sterigmatocystin 8-O-methyltransferase [Pyrenophora tritici-repentis]|nr:Sterigmatocystin 8-O-methyltransferase [Pyrenophora tritici-repentis]
MRQVDIMMMLVLGAKQRTEEQFRRLLSDADARFKIRAIHDKGNMSLIEAFLDIDGKSADGQEEKAALESTKRTGARM